MSTEPAVGVPTDEDVLVAVEEALEGVLLPDPGFRLLEAARNAVLDAVGPLVARLRQAPAVPVPPPTDQAAVGLASVRPQTLANLATHLDARAVAILRPESEVYAEWQTVVAWLRRLAAEAPTTTKPETATLAAVLDGLHTLIATSSRDWGTYRVDAWLWAVLCGWDCEEQHEHDGLCDQGAAMAEMALRHGWDHDTVAKARRYRAAVRALTKPAAGAEDGLPVEPCPPGCVACATDESHDPQPAAGVGQDGAQSS